MAGEARGVFEVWWDGEGPSRMSRAKKGGAFMRMFVESLKAVDFTNHQPHTVAFDRRRAIPNSVMFQTLLMGDGGEQV